MRERRPSFDPKNPPGLGKPAVLLPRRLLDESKARANSMPGVEQLKHVSDDLLIATLVDHGQPRWSAEQLRHSPTLRFCALRFWCDVQDAAEGDRDARERVDYCREMWRDMRRAELIADHPTRVVGMIGEG